ncbi:hypothetical protein ROR02_14010 [Pararhodospirillum oryzae]|uniref:Abi-like protein n=2 Tax=Pararhodospirillum oryzae TaxID=478448 RepID=A0A512H7B9_9PROT|nr:hypothetical protein ROR02_14010 [Pararhodospirillum oryzae]
MSVNGFLREHADRETLLMSLSPERVATYLAETNDDLDEALHLYTWNTALCAAFYGPLQGLEVSLRNALHRELVSRYGPHWYDDPDCPLDRGARSRVANARENLNRNRYPVDPPHMVAALSFGFWVSLLGKGGKQAGSSVSANYEMAFWRPALHRAFPKVKAKRGDVHEPLDYLRTLRNRIAHHEPIFKRDLAADHTSILMVAGWICPVTRDWIAYHSRVPEILALPKEARSSRF